MARRRKQEKNVYSLPVIRPETAGIDIGATQIYVAIAPDRDPEPVRMLGTFPRDLRAIADWLRASRHGIDWSLLDSAVSVLGVVWI
jgi:transposase